MQTRTIRLLPKQLEFLRADDREVLYSGAFGAGKSRALCYKLAMRAATKGAREGLCRKHLVTLKATTLKTLLEQDGELPPVLPLGSYEHNKSDKTIRIKGGGEIQYFGLDEPEKIGSYNLSGCAIDESVELVTGDYTQLRGRIRVQCGIPNQIYSACNPGTPSHFLAERFGLALGHRPTENCRAIVTRTEDNFFLPASYLEDLETLGGVAYKRFVLGQWVGSEGMIYDRWDRAIYQQSREGPWKRVIVGVDEGYTNPAVLLVVCEDSDGRIHIPEEWYQAKQIEPLVVEQAKELQKKYTPECFVVDPSAAGLIAALEEQGLPVEKANNEVFGGIQGVQRRMSVAGDGKPRITISPECQETIREIESYEWMDSANGLKDKPKKANDHAMDAMRYAVRYVDEFTGTEPFLL